MSTPAPEEIELDRYDAGLLASFGGGNVDWWQDYLRAELERSRDFYAAQVRDIIREAERRGRIAALEEAAKIVEAEADMYHSGALAVGQDWSYTSTVANVLSQQVDAIRAHIAELEASK